MSLPNHKQTAVWLIVSAVLLATLIPGGPVENRDFSHIHPVILSAFNVFLTVLNLGSFALAYFAYHRHNWSLRTSFFVATAYFAVYAIDLAQIFPQSPTPMSFALALIEVLGMTAAVPLMFSARTASTAQSAPVTENKSFRTSLVAAMVALGIGIVWFATDAAMNSDGHGAQQINGVEH